MRDQEQHSHTTAASGVQAEKQEQATQGALTPAGGSSCRGGGIAVSAASPFSQEAGSLKQENSHGLAGVETGEGGPDESAAQMSISFEDVLASSVPDTSSVGAAQKEEAGPDPAPAEPEVSKPLHPPTSPARLSDSGSHDATASSSSDGPDISGSGIHTYQHYKVGKDVILRLEYISPKETKACTVKEIVRTDTQ